MARLEQDIDPETPLDRLRVGQQQIVEIAKAPAQNARILILDEPTSALSAAEVLFRIIANLKRQGVGIVYISHRLDELIRVGDHITVLRDGEITGSRPMAGVDIPRIVHAENITLPRLSGGFTVGHVSLSLRAGEILGLYGLMGAGRAELLECVMAQHPHSGGQLYIAGHPLTELHVAGRIRR